MKILRAANLICICISLVAPEALCQSSGFGGGAFLSVGGASSYTPGVVPGIPISLAGVYAEWLAPRVHPGLDLRVAGGATAVCGTLVGPRASVSIARDWLHPYAEALFGPNHADILSPAGTIIEPGQQAPNTNRDGVTVQGVVGMDMNLSQHWRWRLEFTQSRFSGIPGSHPHAVTAGIVVHFR
jgi:hypothetical protein